MDAETRGIIYCATRTGSEELCGFINEKFVHLAAPYHAGMEEETKKSSVKDWHAGAIKILVATKAFGMGIDNQNVRFVLHRDLPDSVLDYVQESGRGGRDGKLATAVILFKENATLEDDDPDFNRSKQEMLTWARNENICRRFLLQVAVDGPNAEGVRCAYSSGYVLCDVCERARMRVMSHDERDNMGNQEVIPKGVGLAVLGQAGAVQGNLLAETTKDVNRTKILLSLRGSCVLCFVLGERADHRLNMCRHMRGRCLCCHGRGHGAGGCPNRVRFPERAGICYGCGLDERWEGEGPVEREEVTHYDGQHGGKCAWRETVLPICWYAWHHERERLKTTFKEAQGLGTASEYATWLSQLAPGSQLARRRCRCIDVFEWFMSDK